MRSSQFWILLLCSSFVSLLLLKQIFLSRALDREQRVLVDSQETIAQGSGFENAWQQLAAHIYQASRQGQDAALAQVLKDENLEVHTKAEMAASAALTNADSGSAPTPTPSAPPASSKTPPPPHPATP